MSANDVASAMQATGLVEVIKVNDGKSAIQITHRLLPKDKPRLRDWLGVLEYVLSRKQGWEDHICKRYFYQGGKIRYCWNFIIQIKNLKQREAILKNIAKAFMLASGEVTKSFHQLASYPLVGVKEGRNIPQGPQNFKAAGPMTGGLSQKGAHKL